MYVVGQHYGGLTPQHSMMPNKVFWKRDDAMRYIRTCMSDEIEQYENQDDEGEPDRDFLEFIQSVSQIMYTDMDDCLRYWNERAVKGGYATISMYSIHEMSVE